MGLLVLNSDIVEYKIYSNITIEDDVDFKVKSQHTNDILFETVAYVLESNERYTSFIIYQDEFEWSFDAGLSKDIDGIYNYELILDNTVVDYGLIKIINVDNTLQTEGFISTNEDGKSRVVYKPI